jgi:hypothetical protein
MLRSAARVAVAAAFAFVLAPAPAPARAQQALQERLDLAALQRIRDEGQNRSQLDTLAQQLLDGIGSRLTGSTGMRNAQSWAVRTLQSWGLANVALEPWDSLFGRGWDRVSFSGRVLEPYVQPLRAEPQAWSGSTRGTVTCPVVLLEVTDTTQLATYTGRLRGSCVMWRRWSPIAPEYTPAPRRFDADSLVAWGAQRPQPPAQQPRFQGGPQVEVEAAITRFLRREQPAALLLPSLWTYGLLRTGGHPDGRVARDSAYEPAPALMLTHEQYGQLYRLAKRGVPARLEVNVQNRWVNPDRREYNVIGEIPGGDLRHQVVMIGAHFDSWHSGTGATDNGAGSLVMMEAMRILKTLNLPMRRTVRIALWSGEEQGLLGSRHWVRMHEAELPNISAYLNVDNGSGRLRGIYGQYNEDAVRVFDQILAPFRDVGFVANRLHATGGTDHLAFDPRGVPGFQFIQDPLEYSIRSHHSYVDTYERLVMDDLKQAATVVAWCVYTIANRDEMLPRKAPRPQASGGN